jgi:hypothetical protein
MFWFSRGEPQAEAGRGAVGVAKLLVVIGSIPARQYLAIPDFEPGRFSRLYQMAHRWITLTTPAPLRLSRLRGLLQSRRPGLPTVFSGPPASLSLAGRFDEARAVADREVRRYLERGLVGPHEDTRIPRRYPEHVSHQIVDVSDEDHKSPRDDPQGDAGGAVSKGVQRCKGATVQGFRGVDGGKGLDGCKGASLQEQVTAAPALLNRFTV